MATRTLVVGDWTVRFEGLGTPLAERLDLRWGPFVDRATRGEPSATVAVGTSDGRDLLPSPAPGERYRVEPIAGHDRAIASHGFSLAALRERPGAWRIALAPSGDEPAERRIENAARFVVATLALDAGGLALHAAGVLLEGRAFLLAGPSRAGKSTAVRRCGAARSLGDDFGVLVPRGAGWSVVAVPFDNSERVEIGAALGLYPLSRVLRVFQAGRTYVEEVAPLRGAASLVTVVAFPWAVPGRSTEIAERAARLCAAGRFAHLHFSRDADLSGMLAALP